MKPPKLGSKEKIKRAARKASARKVAPAKAQDIIANGRTPLDLFVHAIGNSISAAALQVEVLAGSGLSPSQRDRAEAALAQLRSTLAQLDALRERRGHETIRSD